MAKNNEFDEEMRKSDAAAYRASLGDEPGMESTRDFMKRTGTKAKAPRAMVGGPRVVSKKELEASGMSLRDFLNKERGLTRRKTDTDLITEGAAKLYNEAGVGFKPGLMSPDQIAAAEALTMPNEESRFALSSMRGELGTMKKGGVVKKMKSGGTVSSASKRADGIAMKGKTKGRIV